MTETLQIPYSLSIRITTDGFSFTLKQGEDTILKRSVYCPESLLDEKLLTELQQQNLLGKQFQHTYVVLHTKSQTVPNELYRPEDETIWFTSLHPTKRLHEIIIKSQYIPELGCYTIFSIPKKVYLALQEALGENITYQHVSAELIAELLQHRDKHLAIYQHQKNVDMVVMNNGGLLLSNQFSTQNDTDIAYWVLNAIEQFKLPTNLKTILVLPEQTSGLNNLLQKLLS